MNYINLSDHKNRISMDTIGSESATSSYAPEVYNKNQSGGWWFFNNSNNKNLAIKACTEREFAALSFMIRNDVVTDFSETDRTNGCTVLHYVCKFYREIPHVNEVINKILASKNLSSFINKQDDNKNTALHIALETENHELCELLIQHGADPKIRNAMGNYILTDAEPVVECQKEIKKHIDVIKHIDIDVKKGTRPNIFAKKRENYDIDDKLTESNLVQILLALEGRRKQKNNIDVTQTEFTENMPAQLGATTVPLTDLIDTDDFIQKVMEQGNQLKKVQSTNVMPMNEFRDVNMTGGSSKNSKVKVFGSRRMNLYSDFDVLLGGSEENENDFDSDDNMEDELEGSDTESSDELSRQVKTQVDIIHDRTIDKIAEIMGVSRDIARNYKAALYRQVKDSKPELNGYERAIEMEKMATKDVLDKIDIDRVTADIKKHIEEREKNGKTAKPEKVEKPKGEKKASKPRKAKAAEETSSASLMSESDLSSTSAY